VSIFQLSDEDAKEKLRYSIPSSIPEYIKTDSGDVVAAIEALALVCRRMAEPCRWSTIQGEFRRSVASLSRIFICTISFLYHKHKDRLFLNMNVLRKRINEYCEATRLKGSPLRTCFGFIDGTKHVISRPAPRKEGNRKENLQRSVFSGHKRNHCFNWQGICTPDGLCISLYGPLEGRKHDSTVFVSSGIHNIFQEDQLFNGKVLYGDAGYPVLNHLVAPFGGASLTPEEEVFNTLMSSCRQSVEWLFKI
jgi:hypothetical protein